MGNCKSDICILDKSEVFQLVNFLLVITGSQLDKKFLKYLN